MQSLKSKLLDTNPEGQAWKSSYQASLFLNIQRIYRAKIYSVLLRIVGG